MPTNDRDIIHVVGKAINLLETLSRSKTGFTVSELSAQMGLPKTTVFRLLMTLAGKGYVEKIPNSERYQLGVRLLMLGTTILDRMDLRSIARPFIEDLARKTREVVHLAILDAEEVVYIDKVESLDHPIRIYSQIGRRVPAYCTGLGKVLLSGLSDQGIDAYVAQNGLKKFTEKTITDSATLKKELAGIREKKYGIDDAEHEEGIFCVAAPLFERSRKMAGAISVSGPVIYITKERLPEIIACVTETAGNISRSLGFQA